MTDREMGTLQEQDPVCSSEPLELVDGAVGRRMVGAGSSSLRSGSSTAGHWIGLFSVDLATREPRNPFF